MNFTLLSLPWKKFQVKAGYRHYDYNNDTPVRTFTPVEGDASSPGDGEENTPFGFNRKNFELTGNWFFAKKSSAKLGYQVEWMDRSHRDVEHSVEQTFLGAVDVVHGKDLTLRLSYRHSVRNPDAYQDDQSNDPATGALIECNSSSLAFTADQRCSRRFDESHRVRNRGDALIEYDLSDRLSFSAFGGTIQDDYNQRSHTNSSAALNFLTGAAATTSPYYLYGILKDISYLAGDECEGRGITTKGIHLAADHIAGVFKEYGLKPGGTEGWFQPFEVARSGGVLGSGNALAIKGPKDQTTKFNVGQQFVQLFGLDIAAGNQTLPGAGVCNHCANRIVYFVRE
jgi:hypothetical protein